MLQAPFFYFGPPARITSQRGVSQFLRGLMAIGIAALLLLAPLSFTANSQQSSGSKASGFKHFVLYQNAAGEVVCRAATRAEGSQLDSINPSSQGLKPINHLQSDRYAHRTSKANAATLSGTNLTIILRATTQLQNNAPAQAAFIRAAQNWETLILSPVTIYIDVDFGTTNFGTPWPSQVLGSTGTPSRSYPYQSVRANLIAEANGEGNATKQAIFNSLPSTTVPTDLGNASTTDVPDANARAIGLLPATAQTGDPAAQIAFNSNFPYDFDPSNGITGGQTDFDAVATHEIGHALGFDSDAGGGLTRPAVWDLYRFRTGTTSGTFTTAPRIMTIGGSPDSLQYYFFPDNINAQQGLSTGGPNGDTTNGGDGWQSSHWKHASINPGGYIGIMDPAISSGVRRQITSNDALALGSFGYNLDNSNPPPPPPPPPPAPANDNFANAQVISGCTGSVTGTNIGATHESGEPSHDPLGNAGASSVWYQWQAPTSNSVTITTLGSDYDTMLGIYTGSSVNGLTTIAKNDDVDTNAGIITSTVTFNATAGTTYKIAVDGWGGDTGSITLNWSESGCVPPPSPTPTPLTVRLTASDFPVSENVAAGFVTVSVIREGDATSAASVNYATSDTAGLTPCSQGGTGKASERCDYATSLGTLSWAAGEAGTKSFNIPIINDAIVEGTETFNVTLSNPIGVSLGTPSTATVTILDDDVAPSTNPIDGVDFFITQQYIDFLGRMPDQGGFTSWHNTLAPCPNGGFGEAPTSDPTSNCDRLHVAAGFFQSAEFLNRGYWAFCFYMVSYNQRPTYAQFIPDMAQVGGQKSPTEEDASKAAFADAFVQTPAFLNKYPSLSGQALANSLLQTAGLPSSTFTVSPGMTNGQVLRGIVETSAAFNQFLADGTVAIQYFGFLRRDPDTTGYQNNLATLRSDPNNLRHMIFIFIYSPEYRGRFGTP
jgi:hypothetical protein